MTTKDICGCCHEEMEKTIYVEDTMGNVCVDCAEGIINGVANLRKAGIEGITEEPNRTK
jgi:hypothetical protein